MTLLGPRETAYVQQEIGDLSRQVELVVFSDRSSEASRALEGLAAEMAAAVPALRVRVESPTGEAAERFGIEGLAPALALVPDGDGAGPANGIRFFGFPGGYEFNSLLDAIRRVAEADPGLEPELLGELLSLQEPLHLQVFVTPSCPYCPRMVQLAHRMALASPLVRGDMVDATEFPKLADLYEVQGVPLTVINGEPAITGLVPEQRMAEELHRAIS
jgi:glutaredoxin-like protein